MLVSTQRSGERGVEPVEVAGVGDHKHGAAPAGETRGGRFGEPGRPVFAGQRAPHGARHPSGGERPHQRRAGRVAPPSPGRRNGHVHGRRWTGRRRFHPCVPGRHREPEHVGQRAGVAVGDLAAQERNLLAQHPLG
jgi:hypothetical protein